MAGEAVDYGPVIADLELKISALQRMVATLKAIATGTFVPGALAIGAEASGLDSELPSELPVGALINKSIPEAVKLYLAVMKKKLTAKEIGDGLIKNGVETKADDFMGVLNSSLNRLRKNGELIRFPDGWRLAEHVPAHLRNVGDPKKKSIKKRPKKMTSPKKAARQEKKSAATAPPGEPKVQAKATDNNQNGISVEKATRDFLLANPTRAYQAADLAKLIDRDAKIVSLLLGKMAHKGIINKVGNGYQAIKQAGH